MKLIRLNNIKYNALSSEPLPSPSYHRHRHDDDDDQSVVLHE